MPEIACRLRNDTKEPVTTLSLDEWEALANWSLEQENGERYPILHRICKQHRPVILQFYHIQMLRDEYQSIAWDRLPARVYPTLAGLGLVIDAALEGRVGVKFSDEF